MQEDKTIIPAVISIISLIFSLYFYYTLLPLQEANVIFSASDIIITPNVTNPWTNSLGTWIIPSISNIGKSRAENINFTIYVIQTTSSAQLLFDDSLVTNLEPGEKTQFGAFGSADKLGIDMFGKPGIVVFHLSYIDSLTKKQKNSVSMYTYLFGKQNSIASLVKSDYKYYYKGLLESVTTTTDDYLYKYLKDNPPNY